MVVSRKGGRNNSCDWCQVGKGLNSVFYLSDGDDVEVDESLFQDMDEFDIADDELIDDDDD